MIVNMACPKCGGQSTEYDDKKWSCLRCGNKFVYEPTQATHTFVQSNVSIQGQAAFELDVENGRLPLPKMVKMIEHDPSFYGKQIEGKQNAINVSKALKYPIHFLKIFSLFVCVVVVIGEVFLGLSILTKKSNSDDDIIGFFASIGVFVVSFMLFWKFRKSIKQHDLVIQGLTQKIHSLECDNRTDTKIGDYIICPSCESHFEFIPTNSIPPADSLKHCLSCGKQFYTSGLNSYPIKHK